jgi:type II secretory ATPase GspE/PulE/Tfp pilus assembly ATPase PilB-like protein
MLAIPDPVRSAVHDTVPGAFDASPHSGTLDSLWNALEAPPRHRAAHLGEALMVRGLITPEQLAQVLTQQGHDDSHHLLGRLLVERGFISEEALDATLAEWLSLRVVDLRELRPETAALMRVPQAVAEREGVLPLMVRDETLVVAVLDPADHELIYRLRFLSDLKVRTVAAVPGTLQPAIARAYRPLAKALSAVRAGTRSLKELASDLQAETVVDEVVDPSTVLESDNTLVKLVNQLIQDAIDCNASDIHIETVEAPRPVVVRLRIDGDLLRHVEIPAQYRYALVARLKIMADLDIAEHRKPQDGKIDFARFGGPHVELRIVTVPTARGLEDVVLRLLSGLEPLPIDRIGLSTENLAAMRRVMAKAYGLILICGPTGSGKTTTLHSVMRELNVEKRKIWTAEDPVEITQEGLRQVQVNARIGWTFAAAMRTFLRADPDVVMIGEMRDEETARIAVEASLTGHLVMSTLHTNSAPESITRLLEIGLDPYMFSDSLLAILAQRLVRRLCLHCREAESLDEAAVQSLAHQYLQSSNGHGPTEATLIARWRDEYADRDGRLHLYRHRGCKQCSGSGYRGRMGIHELLVSDESLREGIRHRASASALQESGLRAGMVTLRQDGIEKALSGLTDMAEVLAAANQ